MTAEILHRTVHNVIDLLDPSFSRVRRCIHEERRSRLYCARINIILSLIARTEIFRNASHENDHYYEQRHRVANVPQGIVDQNC